MPLKNVRYFIKRNSKKSILFLIMLYATIGLITAVNSTTGEDRNDCGSATKLLGGGTHNYEGRDYLFTLCGNTAYSRFGSNINTFRLQIRDENQELLVERFFDVVLGGGSPKLEYADSSVTYFDESSHGDYTNVVPMPPSRQERLKVRIKHAFWQCMEFVFIKPLKWIFSPILVNH